MDPDEALSAAREFARRGSAAQAAQQYSNLDRWVSSGGFLPEDWKPVPPVPENLKLTPTADLMLEVLAARTRLGHTIWNFESVSSVLVAAKRLADAGLITTMSGNTEGTFRAELTKVGRAYAMSDRNYVPPILGGPK